MLKGLLRGALLMMPLLCRAQCTYSAVTTGTLASTFAGATTGQTICLKAGNYGSFSGSSKAGMVTLQADTTNGGTQANVIFGALALSSASYITMNNMTIAGGNIGNGSTPATHIYLKNIIFSDSLCIHTPTDANIDILIDSSSFINIGQSCTEGRLGITAQNNSNKWSTPNGVVISNSLFSGTTGAGASDGIQLNGGAYGTQIGPGNTFQNILEGTCGAVHCDAIQFYGARATVITGNFFYNNSDGIMSPDCNGSPMTVTNNVFVQEIGSATNEIIVGGGNGDVFDHNTFGTQNNAAPRFGNPNGCGLNTNITITNSVLPNGISLTDGQSTSTFTQDYNLISGGGTGSHTRNGSPIFVGGAAPTTYSGYVLAPNSPGYNAASNGASIGIPGGTTGSAPNPPTLLSVVIN